MAAVEASHRPCSAPCDGGKGALRWWRSAVGGDVSPLQKELGSIHVQSYVSGQPGPGTHQHGRTTQSAGLHRLQAWHEKGIVSGWHVGCPGCSGTTRASCWAVTWAALAAQTRHTNRLTGRARPRARLARHCRAGPVPSIVRQIHTIKSE